MFGPLPAPSRHPLQPLTLQVQYEDGSSQTTIFSEDGSPEIYNILGL